MIDHKIKYFADIANIVCTILQLQSYIQDILRDIESTLS